MLITIAISAHIKAILASIPPYPHCRIKFQQINLFDARDIKAISLPSPS